MFIHWGENFPLPHNCFCLCSFLLHHLFREKGLFGEVIHCSVDFPAHSVHQLPLPFPLAAASPQFTHSPERIDSLLRFIFGFQLLGSSQLPRAGMFLPAPPEYLLLLLTFLLLLLLAIFLYLIPLLPLPCNVWLF